MGKVVIDGRCIEHRNLGGTRRYAVETLLELDKIVEKNKYELLIKPECRDLIELKNIRKVEIYSRNVLSWKIKIFWYLFNSRAWYVNFANGLCICKNSIMTVHDIYAFFDMYHTIKKTKMKLKTIFNAMFAKKIVTVSEYSKQTMLEKLSIKPDRIRVIGNGWQHIKKRQPDDKVLERCGLQNKQYYLYVGRLEKNKNIKWIYEVADSNSAALFVISGDLDREPSDLYKGKYGNIIYTGFVTDSEMKSLYQYCKAFLFPSIMEGFGIPPMEALYNGVPIIIANTSSLPEVYGKCAHYIDPYKYDYDLDEILKEPVEPANSVLDRYSWEKSAREWKELIESCTR